MKTPTEIGEQVRQAFGKQPGGFRPCAYFDVRLDCIRILARDCSIFETRVNEVLTLLEDNYYPESGSRRYVGFTVKGARHFCQEHELNLGAPIKISALLDAILAAFPNLVGEMLVDGIARPLVEEEKIERVDVGISGSLQPA